MVIEALGPLRLLMEMYTCMDLPVLETIISYITF